MENGEKKIYIYIYIMFAIRENCWGYNLRLVEKKN